MVAQDERTMPCREEQSSSTSASSTKFSGGTNKVLNSQLDFVMMCR
uniref:Uncharacterized protein n=1 Tax=Arundo donax TaxID=35708 RepID=A0A0A9D2Y4_ARUDO